MYAMTVMDDRSFRWREVPDPVAGNGELLVEIHAAALNRAICCSVPENIRRPRAGRNGRGWKFPAS